MPWQPAREWQHSPPWDAQHGSQATASMPGSQVNWSEQPPAPGSQGHHAARQLLATDLEQLQPLEHPDSHTIIKLKAG